jgi:hypothetical protein
VAAKDGGEEWVVVSNAGEEWARRMAVKMVVVETGGRDGGNEAVRSGQACAAVGLRAAVGVRWAVGTIRTSMCGGWSESGGRREMGGRCEQYG